ncbi:pantothenate transporter [Teratosphaeria nubilosa]|uniref:Pantothenate transporter n=1 Tax=Teratosphaeria nubilosa TaxID=161662 RepID=A0A6G1LK59_9PEZI|nr:pantothenate transporter [Teratosphaeria nubilosa]
MEEKRIIFDVPTGSSDEGSDYDADIYKVSPEDDARVRRKIDMVVLPMMCLVFFTQFLDKQSLSYASVYGLMTDLKLTHHQFSWLTSCFFLSQLVSEWPFIYLMSRLPLAKFVGATIIVWGGICMCLAAPSNFAGFAAVRCLLGFAEGAVSPAFITITSIWYRKKEHPLRVATWVTCNGLAQIVGALLMYGIGEQKQLAIAAWRVMFMVCGGITIFAGILFIFAMPAGPESAWFLTPEERNIAAMRLASEHDGGDKTHFSMKQFLEAITDQRTFLTFMFGLLVTMGSPVLTFVSLIIKGLGYTGGETLLYGSPSGAVQIAFVWLGVTGCWFFPNKRSLVVLLVSIVPLTGCILLIVLPESTGWGKIVASWLASVISGQFSILMSLSASNVRGNTKKAVVNAVFFVGYCTGGVAAPQLWTKPPRYINGVICALVNWCLVYVIIPYYWWTCKRENRKRDRMHGEGMVQFVAGTDVTDKEDKAFRYTT